PNVLASVLLLDGRQLRHGAAPSLPQAYNEAINGLTIGPSEGSCGTAACRAEPVIVSDIAVDPLWAKHRDLALSYSLRACWSTLIVSSQDEVLGTFAMYYREPRTPTSRHRELIELATHLVRVAIERDRTGQALRASEQLARTHAYAMMRSLEVLVTETAPGKLIVEMLKTIGQHLGAIRVTFWLHNPKDDSLSLQMVIEDGEQVALHLDHPWVVDPSSWKTDPVVQQMVVTKARVVCDSVERDVRITPEHRRYLTSKGCKRFMVIPLSMLGELHGFIGIHHVERATYCAEEIEFAEALAHHLMIATHTQELAQQQRQAAILEERTRM